MTESNQRPPTVVCLASYFKGTDFVAEAVSLGWKVVLITREKLIHEAWPRNILEDVWAVSDAPTLDDYLDAVIKLGQRFRIEKIVALEEFDVLTAANVREYLTLPGMSASRSRLFRDKLSMRTAAETAGISVPPFVIPLNPESLKEFVEHVPAPWVLKPRSDVSAIGIKKFVEADSLWAHLNQLDERLAIKERPPSFVLEKYLPGEVFHVDSIVSKGRVAVAVSNRYRRPPMDVAHGGGTFLSQSLIVGSREDRALQALNRKILKSFGLENGVSHAEFIRSEADGRFYFLEVAARVGGAFLANLFEAATGLNLWREWARVELLDDYAPPAFERSYSGIALSLARQEWPDTSSFTEAEIVYRVNKPYHVGLVVCSKDHTRVGELLDQFARRFEQEYSAVAAPKERVE